MSLLEDLQKQPFPSGMKSKKATNKKRKTPEGTGE